MELWVRTADRRSLLKPTNICIGLNCSRWGVYDGNQVLGEYKTEERCLEIIDEIQKLLLSTNGDYLIKLQDIDVNAEEKTVYGENFIQKLQSPIMPIANEPSVSVIQPSVLVYEMPQE